MKEAFWPFQSWHLPVHSVPSRLWLWTWAASTCSPIYVHIYLQSQTYICTAVTHCSPWIIAHSGTYISHSVWSPFLSHAHFLFLHPPSFPSRWPPSASVEFNTWNERATTWPCSTHSTSAWSPSPRWGLETSPLRSGRHSSWWSSWSLWHSLCFPFRWENTWITFGTLVETDEKEL